MLTAFEEQEELWIRELEEYANRYRQRDRWFPDRGPYRRALYAKSLEFFAAGKARRERLFIAGNRVSKSTTGLYELVCHLTGEYPAWWEGRRFPGPIHAWAAGDTGKTTRDILQFKLLGTPGDYGSGMLPKAALRRTTPKHGLADAVESVYVRHETGGESVLLLKSYDQRREAFQGTAQHVILLDEEPPIEIGVECLLRTMATGEDFEGGMIMYTFTPLMGLSEIVLSFLPGGDMPADQSTGSRYVVMASWDDVPHLTEADKIEMLRVMPAHQRDARTRGIPRLSAGVIYPVPESEYLVDDFAIPAHWWRAYGMDVGWDRTAAVWGAYDKDSHRWYLYSEHYQGHAEPSVHTAAIKARGDWIRGVIDPAARGRTQDDGAQLMETYQNLGLSLNIAMNGVYAGIYQTFEGLSTGGIKVFKSLLNWRKEARLYQRDARGNIIKKDDHLMDGTRYLVMSGHEVWRQVPVVDPEAERGLMLAGTYTGGWMA